MQVATDLGRFVPLHALSSHDTGDTSWVVVDGTLCHIDISGFTNLSERLAARGRVGAEELTEVLDRIFGSMIALAGQRGGSLLKFGGDALLLLFEGDDHAVQAASAAVEMRATLREAAEIPTSVGRLSLRMSTGLYSGEVHLFRASGTHRELIVAGPAASMVTEMEETASAGEIVLSPSTKALLPDDSAVKPIGDGWLLRWRATRASPSGARDATGDVSVDAHIPTALRPHLTETKLDSEHRLATVAFVEFIGLDAFLAEQGAENTSVALDGLISEITEIVDAEEVTFLGTDVDRDAGKIILVSGVPVTFVDESGRVLRAARRIADIDTPFDLKIGVNRGHVFSGEIGTENRSTFTVMGDAVNLAARLMAAAPPGSVYTTIGALDDSGTLFETEALDPISVKGKTEPVAPLAVLAEVGSRGARVAHTLPFAGRDRELQQVSDAVAALRDGVGGSIVVHGPTGIGKSRLVDESLTGVDMTTLEIRSEPYGAANPYRPFRDPLRDLLNIERGPNEKMAAALQKATEKQAPDLVSLTPLIGDLTHIDLPPTDVTRTIDSRYRQNRVADTAVDLLDAVVSGPLIVVAEDVHWADAATSSLLARLARETEQRDWLVITTSRNAPEESGDSDLALDPLDATTTRTLVNDATETSPLRPDDVAAIVERSGGSPLFVQELLRVVRETGSTESLPTSLDGVVGSQIDALEPLARRVLRYVSVLGRSFRTSVARDLLRTQDIELDAATSSMLDAFLDDDGSDRLQFRHALVRDVAYEGLSYRRRRELHLQAGQLVLNRAHGEQDAVADLLALHFFLGGDHAFAWKYCRMAGDQNMAMYANPEAASQYERALEAAKRLDAVSDEGRRDTWIKLGDVRERSGQFEASLDAYHRAARLTGQDAVKRAQVYLKRARAKERAGSYPPALVETTRATRLLTAEHDSAAERLLADAMSFAATIRQAQQKPKLALRIAREASVVAERANNDLALARAWRVMDHAHVMLGQPNMAVYSAKALETYRRMGHLEMEAVTSTNLGAYAYWSGDWNKALEYYELGRSASTRAGNAVDAAMASANIGEVLVNQGRYEEAEEPLTDARRTYRASGFAEGVAFVDLLLGRMHSIRGSLNESIAALSESIGEAEELGLSGFRLEASIHLADAQCRFGSPERGLKTLEEAESDAPDVHIDYYQPLLSRIRGSILNSAGRHDESVAMLEHGINVATERQDTFEFGLLVLTLARVEEDSLKDGQKTDAQEALRSLDVRSAPGISLTA